MSENCASIWIWNEPDVKCKENVLDFIKNEELELEETAVLRCRHIKGFNDILPLTTYILQLCQRYKLLKNERTTFLSYKDHFTAIELCLSRMKHKNDESEFTVSKEEVTKCHNDYITHFEESEKSSSSVLIYEEFLMENNCINLWLMLNLLQSNLEQDDSLLRTHLSKIKFLVLGCPQAEIFKKMLSLLITGKQLCDIIVETPLDVSLNGSDSPMHCSPSSIKVYSENIDCIPINSEFDDCESATKEYVEDMFTAFFSLLINSRNELALSKAMISPIINLSHAAFTELKHLSVDKEMPMCQTAVSYVTKVRLGGKGYAPSDNCTMLPHIKALEQFVDMLNHLQTIVEEHPPELALKKLIAFVKKRLLKSSEQELKMESVEAAAENMLSTGNKLLNSDFQETVIGSQACEKTLTIIYNLVNYVTTDSWNGDPQIVLKDKEDKKTPLNLPPLLGYYRSPEEESEEDTQNVMSEDSNTSTVKSQIQPTVSYFHHNSNSSTLASCVDNKTPSKTSFNNCLTRKENEAKPEKELDLDCPTKKSNSSKNPSVKRPILSEVTNQSAPKRANKPKKETAKTSKKETAKKTKTKQQIKGQGKLTSFFIYGQ